MITKIEVDDLKIWEQMRLKMGKKLRTASLNSKFNGSYKSVPAKSLRRRPKFLCFVATIFKNKSSAFFLIASLSLANLSIQVFMRFFHG